VIAFIVPRFSPPQQYDPLFVRVRRRGPIFDQAPVEE
jgi:hypothetical protein